MIAQLLFLNTYILLNMICYCPHCGNELPEILVDGVIFCPNCNRIITSSKKNEYIAAYRILKKNTYTNYDQLRQHLKISQKDMERILEYYEEKNFSVEEFEKQIKTGAIPI